MIDEEHPTPELGYPVQADPRLESASRHRVRTPPGGVPIVRARSRADTDEIDLDLTDAFERLLSRKLRWLWRLVGAALVAAGGAVLSVVGRMMDAREASGAEKTRLRYMEDEIRILRSRDEERLRRDDQPSPWPWRIPTTGASPLSPAPRPAAPTTPPASKEP